MTPSGVENITIELIILKNSHFELEILFLALLEVKNELKWPKFTILTLKYDLLTLKMTPSGVENVTIELAILKNPHLKPEILFLALLEERKFYFQLTLCCTISLLMYTVTMSVVSMCISSPCLDASYASIFSTWGYIID